jgi:L-threonylcarbamoyladenylate synthase
VENLRINKEICQAVEIIRNGGLVAFPTETFYGLAVDPFNESALRRLFEVKKRPADKAVLVLINKISQLSLFGVDLPQVYQPLIDHFWPGPLTLIFKVKLKLPGLLCGGTDTIGVRISSNPVARKLISAVGQPITATSANISGEEPAKNSILVSEQFGNSLNMIIDGGETYGKKGSTILKEEAGRLIVVRRGEVSEKDIMSVVC